MKSKNALDNGEIIRRRLQNRKFLMDEIVIEDKSQDKRIEQRGLERQKPKCECCGFKDAVVTSTGIINEEVYLCLICLELYKATIKRKLT